ncbi:hypothetical protein FB567DRAFT_518470 [Paraphoma chrysanthemicola]|uniref:Uncharacterized protein n=1 Tax=Paraphoma chrysanthemicola TaxID=798071 RepID=A0A8K0RCG3_9PLEO|nr:hypothetical protein FB567DRAFT_518470 [Paraphoma chrysanthemicola]
MATSLSTHHIRRCKRRELCDYFKTLPYQDRADEVTQQLLQAIERGSITPATFATWLGVSKSVNALVQALRQRFSVIVRKDAVKHLGKSFRSPRWKIVWDGLGGTSGLLNVFSQLSVHEVREACKALGRCGKGSDFLEKRKVITELFLGLQPSEFPKAPFKSTDKRPLAKHYRHLLPSCDEELVARVLSGDLSGRWQSLKDDYWMRYHPELMRREQFRSLRTDPTASIDEKQLGDLVNQYPKGTGVIPGFSASMDFALSILQGLVERDAPHLDDYFVINTLARPLLHRALKKNNVWRNIEEIVTAIMQYLEKHPLAGKEFGTTEGDVLHLVASCWSHRPDVFEGTLRKLCSHPVYGTSKHNELTDWDDFLSGIRPSRRYALLRICFQESTGLDIDDNNDLRKVEGKLSDDLLNRLSAEESLKLVRHMRAVRVDDNVIHVWRANTILNIMSTFGGTHADCDLYETILQNQAGRQEEAIMLAAGRLDARKRQAKSASKPEERTFYAQSALYFAVASGSPALYQETLRWADRFSRDPLVFRELYPQHPQSYPREVIRMLSGVPENYEGSGDMANIRKRVQLCNDILVGMFDTACQALREPSFNVQNWHSTLEIFQLVVKERIKQSKKLRKTLSATDEQVYSVLWDHTIEMLIAVEEKANRDEYERLGANTVLGLLEYTRNTEVTFDTQEWSTYKFINNLARRRDILWQKLRPTVHPAVLSLPKPLPRGLAIQHLVPSWAPIVPNLEELAPFIASRVRSAVFPEPNEILQSAPLDEESTAAIGVFVDSYHDAIQLFIPKSCDDAERGRRAKKAWSYAMGPLSRDRMSEKEAHRFWNKAFPEAIQNQLDFAVTPTKDRCWPLLPEVDDPAEPRDWNPFASGRPNEQSRSLGSITCLDLSLAVNNYTPYEATIQSRLRGLPDPDVPADQVETRKIWNSNRNLGEGGVLSALLYLELKFGAAHGRLLGTPFPSEEDARYPSLYLDPEFDGEELNHFTAARCIEGHLDLVPPQLLRQSARNMMVALEASKEGDATGELELALTLLVRLAESDRPGLAHDLALQTVLGRQTASSWHRKLLKSSWFRRLSAKEAQACFSAFADAVLERIETSSSNETEKEGEDLVQNLDDDAPPKQTFVKVTTIKMLAQLLQGTEFVGEDIAFSVLSKLLQRASHVDVRINAIKGLLSMLETSSKELAEEILVVLKSVIAESASLGRALPSDNSGEEDINVKESSPVLSFFIDHYQRSSSNSEHFRTFVSSILLPALEHRTTLTKEWSTRFLKKYGYEGDDLILPIEPRDAGNILKILRVETDKTCFLPYSLVERHVNYSVFKLAPPDPVTEFNNKLRNDRSLRSKSEVQTWLLTYGEKNDRCDHSSIFNILHLLDNPSKLSDHTGITPKFIHEQFLRLFTTVVQADAPTYSHFGRIFAALLNGTYLSKPWWPEHGKPIVEAMIEHVDSLRTRQWERDPNRKPAVLPDTFPWRLLLLDFPWPKRDDTDEKRETKCKQFAKALAATIDGMSGGIYHLKLAQLKTYLALDPISSSADRSVEKKIGHYTIYTERRDVLRDMLILNRILIAIYLGDISTTKLSWITKPDFLKVDVASHLLDAVGEDDWEKIVDKDLRQRVDWRIAQWIRCESEEVRRVGVEVERRLRFQFD